MPKIRRPPQGVTRRVRIPWGTPCCPPPGDPRDSRDPRPGVRGGGHAVPATSPAAPAASKLPPAPRSPVGMTLRIASEEASASNCIKNYNSIAGAPAFSFFWVRSFLQKYIKTIGKPMVFVYVCYFSTHAQDLPNTPMTLPNLPQPPPNSFPKTP